MICRGQVKRLLVFETRRHLFEQPAVLCIVPANAAEPQQERPFAGLRGVPAAGLPMPENPGLDDPAGLDFRLPPFRPAAAI